MPADEIEIEIVSAPFDGPDARLLRDELTADLHGRYGKETEPGVKPTAADLLVFLVARDRDGAPLGCGGLRRLDADTVELKRMYVRPVGRGRGIARRLLAALEAQAARHGAKRVLLETGELQHEAISLYGSSGYGPVPCWGAYADSPISRCFGRDL